MLAQAAAGASSSFSVLLWVGVLVVLAVVGGVAVLAFRRKLLGPGSDTPPEEGLMDSLRRMRDSGQLTKEEFDAARKSMAMKAAARMSAAPPAKHAAKPGPQAKPPEPSN